METNDLIIIAQKGDKSALNELVDKNTKLVWSIIKKFRYYERGYESEDLFQIGCIGLVKAIQKFDISYDVKFSTYAVPMIIGEIKRFLRDDGIIKVSRNLKEISSKVAFAREVLMKKLDREPTIAELAGYLDISCEDIVMAMEATSTPESLCTESGDKISNNENLEVGVTDRMVLKEAINSLSVRDRQIILLRYFKEKTQAQVAKMLGISQVQVSRLEKKILFDIKNKIKSS